MTSAERRDVRPKTRRPGIYSIDHQLDRCYQSLRCRSLMDGNALSAQANAYACQEAVSMYITDMLHLRASRLASRHHCGKCIQTILHVAAETEYILNATASICESLPGMRGEAKRVVVASPPPYLIRSSPPTITPVSRAQTTHARIVFYKSLC